MDIQSKSIDNSNNYKKIDGVGNNIIMFVPIYNVDGPSLCKQVTYDKTNAKILYVLAYENPLQAFNLVFIRNSDNAAAEPSIDMENFRNKCENIAFVIRLLNGEDEYGDKSKYYFRR